MAFSLDPTKALLGDNATTRDKLLFTIGGSAITWYLLSITLVGFEFVKATENLATSPPTTTNIDLRSFMEFSITAISGTLATYLGMILGLSQRNAGQQPGAAPQPADGISTMQKVAAWMYFVSLVYALGLWGWSYSTHTTIAPVISTLGQSILGLFGGALAVLLNTEKQ